MDDLAGDVAEIFSDLSADGLLSSDTYTQGASSFALSYFLTDRRNDEVEQDLDRQVGKVVAQRASFTAESLTPKPGDTLGTWQVEGVKSAQAHYALDVFKRSTR